MKNKNGFTLIELLIVIVIIGILASLAQPVYQKFVLKGRFAEAYTFIGAIRKAQEAYNVECGEYADDLTELDIELPPIEARNFYYSLDVDNPPGISNNDYIIIAHPNPTKSGMANVVEHPHVHAKGAIGIWESNSKNHSHDEYSHQHNIEYGNPY